MVPWESSCLASTGPGFNPQLRKEALLSGRAVASNHWEEETQRQCKHHLKCWPPFLLAYSPFPASQETIPSPLPQGPHSANIKFKLQVPRGPKIMPSYHVSFWRDVNKYLFTSGKTPTKDQRNSPLLSSLVDQCLDCSYLQVHSKLGKYGLFLYP